MQFASLLILTSSSMAILAIKFSQKNFFTKLELSTKIQNQRFPYLHVVVPMKNGNLGAKIGTATIVPIYYGNLGSKIGTKVVVPILKWEQHLRFPNNGTIANGFLSIGNRQLGQRFSFETADLANGFSLAFLNL